MTKIIKPQAAQLSHDILEVLTLAWFLTWYSIILNIAPCISRSREDVSSNLWREKAENT